MDTITVAQVPSRVYFRSTAFSQCQLLFGTVEETGNVTQAAQHAHVSRGTYYWRPRYEAEGVTGLAAERGRVPLRPLCPPRLKSVISDNGTQFIAEVFAQLAQEKGFARPHRAAPGLHQWDRRAFRAHAEGVA